jgi:hypothetical protein
MPALSWASIPRRDRLFGTSEAWHRSDAPATTGRRSAVAATVRKTGIERLMGETTMTLSRNVTDTFEAPANSSELAGSLAIRAVAAAPRRPFPAPSRKRLGLRPPCGDVRTARQPGSIGSSTNQSRCRKASRWSRSATPRSTSLSCASRIDRCRVIWRQARAPIQFRVLVQDRGRVPAHDIGRSDPPMIAIQSLCPTAPPRRQAFQSPTAGIRWPVRGIDCCRASSVEVALIGS